MHHLISAGFNFRRDAFVRASYPIDIVKLKERLMDQEIESAKFFQRAYAKWFSEVGI